MRKQKQHEKDQHLLTTHTNGAAAKLNRRRRPGSAGSHAAARKARRLIAAAIPIPSSPARAGGFATTPQMSARDVTALLAVWPGDAEEIAQLSPSKLHARLCGALRAERQRGLRGHWAYDPHRHRNLARAVRQLGAGSTGQPGVTSAPRVSRPSGTSKKKST